MERQVYELTESEEFINETVTHGIKTLLETGDRTYEKKIGWRSLQSHMINRAESLYAASTVLYELKLNATEHDTTHTEKIMEYLEDIKKNWDEYYAIDTDKKSREIKKKLTHEKQGTFSNFSIFPFYTAYVGDIVIVWMLKNGASGHQHISSLTSVTNIDLYKTDWI